MFKHITTPIILGYDLEWAEIQTSMRGIQYVSDAEMMGISMALELATEQIRDIPALPTRDTDEIDQRQNTQAAPREDTGSIKYKPRIYIFTDSVTSQTCLRSYLHATTLIRKRSLSYQHPIFTSMVYNLNRLVCHGF